MPALLAPWLIKWAALKALGWAGIGRWAKQRTGGLATGSWAWAVVAVAVLIGGLIVWHWIDPPERTYTAAEVRADRLTRENAMLLRATAERDATLAKREAALAEATTKLEKLEAENGSARKGAPHRPGVVFADDDGWLQLKRKRAN